jgi:2-dehydropantoate 2-reductase
MRLVIVGAGATGGFLGACLTRAGADVVLVARGPHLEAMQTHGLRVIDEQQEWTVHPRCTNDLAAIREADAVFLTVKAHSLPALAPRLSSDLPGSAVVVTAQNGIPWWYFQHAGGPLEGTRLETVDPGGIISANLDSQQIVGCVVYPATRLIGPGVIEHIEGTRFSLGELDGVRSERCRAIASVLTAAGLKCPVRPDIRSEIWLKLLGNIAFNPLSALTGATMAEIAAFTPTREIARVIMEETHSVIEALGADLPIGIDQRLAGAERVGAHMTSMLQDLESRRPLELEALVGAVLEIAALLGLSLPTLRCLYAATLLLDRTRRGEPSPTTSTGAPTGSRS